MLIDITGYVAAELSNYSFAIRVTSDKIKSLSLSDIQVSKEVRIAIPPQLYPLGDNSKIIELTAGDAPHIHEINKCLSFAKTLKMGDQIECSVVIADWKTRAINRNRREIETYADFDLWLYPKNGKFRRSVSDSRESLKFRKQWRYTCINKEKCKKITGQLLNKYRHKWWINKNPNLISPILRWIQVKTTASNLWKRFTGQEKNELTIINTVVTIISIVVAIIIVIWFR